MERGRFSAMELGDERLNKRARILMERMSSKPTASIPMAFYGWPETTAAYRFLANEQVGWADVLASHWAQTQQRMSAHPVVLCLQNTTELDLNAQQIGGLGPLNYEARCGMYVHPTYIVTPQREPLGITSAWMWVRESNADTGEHSAPKESTRCIEGYERVAEMADTLPATRLVYVAHREADLVEAMLRAQALGTPAYCLVRVNHNRCLFKGKKLWSHTCAGEPLGEIVYTMGSRKGQRARELRQQLCAKWVDISAGKSACVSVMCIMAREIGAPAGTKPVQWRLLTNRAALALPDVVELIDGYRARLEIELTFHVLKNGCRVEALQLSGTHRIERAQALLLVVAWRIAHLKRTERTCLDLDADRLFKPDEIQGAYPLTKKKRPDRTPPLNEVLRLIATLGGFLARKGDGEPGLKTIWLGLQRVMDAANTIQVLQNHKGLGCI